MRGVIAFCENKKCGAIFESTNIIGGPGSIHVEFINTRVGPCPICGSMGIIPDGVYQYFNEAISFIRGPKASIDKLIKLRESILKFRSIASTRDEVLKEIEKISPDYAKRFKSLFQNVDFHKWIVTIAAVISTLILIYDTCFTKDDSEIKDIIIEQLLEQNRILMRQDNQQKINIGRNDPCYCGSGMKYKYCCLRKK